MDVNITTPVKGSPKAMLVSTPQNQPHEHDMHAEDDLMDSFSAMKVTQGLLYKRTADTMTIEGTPVNISRFKRQDINPTPIKLEGTSYYAESVQPAKSAAVAPKMHTVDVAEKLLVICSASEEHNTGDHQENALRTALLCGEDGCLRRPELRNRIQWIDSDNLTAAPLTDLLRVHEYTYLRYIEEKCKATSAATSLMQGSVPKRAEFPPFYAPTGMLDSDTPLQVQSLEAAKRFCGAAILAVDHVMAGCNPFSSHNDAHVSETLLDEGAQACNRAFVIGRPPGHHAGPNGCVPSEYFWHRPDMASSGFCLLNTVAVAAAYARHQYGRWAWRNVSMAANPVSCGPGTVQSVNRGSRGAVGEREWRAPRIAIVDIDIHHGNGTEEIVRNLTPHTTHLPLPSSWAPVSTLSYKPWLNEHDSDEVFYSSIHLYAAERFYPCSGSDSFPSDATTGDCPTSAVPPSSTVSGSVAGSSSGAPSERIVNIALTPIGPGPWDRKARAKLTGPQRDLLCKQASAEFRSKVTSMLLPRLEKFNADLIFISAGFDAHYDDFYHFLTEQDLHWVTEQLCAVADKSGTYSAGTGGGRDGAGSQRRCGVISVLEGGYSLSSPLPKAKSARTAVPAVSVAGAAAVPPAMPAVAPAVGGVPVGSASVEAAAVLGNGAAMVTSPGGESSGAGSTLGRGGRLKAKKEKAAGTSATASVAGESVAVSVACPIAAVTSPEVKPAAPVGTHSVDCGGIGSAMDTMYAQRPGDGGLVKGVLAHTAALVGCKVWVGEQK